MRHAGAQECAQVGDLRNQFRASAHVGIAAVQVNDAKAGAGTVHGTPVNARRGSGRYRHEPMRYGRTRIRECAVFGSMV